VPWPAEELGRSTSFGPGLLIGTKRSAELQKLQDNLMKTVELHILASEETEIFSIALRVHSHP
jgi:hypothetical protein